MLKTLLDDLEGVQELHKITYTTNPVLDDVDTQLAIVVTDTIKIYQKNITWDEVPQDVSSIIKSYTVNIRKPDGYIGVQVNGTIDSTWPPKHIGHVWIANSKQLIVNNEQYVVNGDFAIVDEEIYMIAHKPLAAGYNWIVLGKKPITTGPWWNDPMIGVDIEGVTEIGKCLDFHNDNIVDSNYSYRVANDGNSLYFSGDIQVVEGIFTSLISDTFTTTDATITNLTVSDVTVDTANITNLTVDNETVTTSTIGDLTVENETVTTSNITSLTVTDVTVDTSNISTLTVDNETVTTSTITTLTVTDLSVNSHTADSITVDTLTATTGTINNLTGDNASFTTLNGTLNSSNLTGTIDFDLLPIQAIIDAVNSYNNP